MNDTSIDKLFAQFAKGTLFVSIGNLVALGIQYGLKFALGRAINPSEFGLMAIGINLLNILALFSLFGLHRGIAQRIPQLDDSRSLYQQSLILVLCTSIFVSILLVLLNDYISLALREPAVKSVIVPFAVAIPFYSIYHMTAGGMRGLKDGKGQMFIQLTYLFLAIATLIAIRQDFGVVAIATAWSVGIVLVGVFSICILFVRTSLLEQIITGVSGNKFKFSSELGTLVLFSLPIMLESGISKLIQQSDVFIVAYFLTNEYVGLYDAAFTSAIGLLFFSTTFGFLSLPLLSELYSGGKINDFNRSYKMITKWMVFFALPFFLTLLIHPNEALHLLFGAKYLPAAPAVSIVALGLFSHVLFGPNRSGVIALGKPRWVLLVNICSLIINIVLNVMLIPEFGIVGAGIASAISYFTMNALLSYVMYNEQAIQPFSKNFLVTTSLSIIVYLILNYSVNHFSIPYVNNIVIFLFVYVVIHSSLILLFGLGKVEQNIINSSLEKLG